MAAGRGVPREPDAPVPPSSRSDGPRRRTVRPVPMPPRRVCARPSCAAPAQATLAFVYDEQIVMLAPLSVENLPQAYDLCGLHASRTRAPRGWALEDQRSPDEPGASGPASMAPDLGGDQTVAVLAAALRAVPDPGVEPAVRVVHEPVHEPVSVFGSGPAEATVDGRAIEAGRPATRPPLARRDRDDA
jgi:hypothetical protein